MATRPAPAPDPRADSGARKPDVLRIVVLVLAAYGAGVGTIALMKAGKASGGSGGGKDTAEVKLDAMESRIRTSVKEDLDRAIAKDKEIVAAEAKRVVEIRDTVRTSKESLEGKVELAARSVGQRTDELTTLLDDAKKEGESIRSDMKTVSGLMGELRELIETAKSQPAPVATTPPPPVVPVPPPAVPTPTEPAGPTPKTPEEKAAVQAAIQELAAAVKAADVTATYTAANKLKKLDDIDAIEPLMKAVREFPPKKDPDGYARGACVIALGSLHACDAVPLFLELFLDKENSLAVNAGIAFTKVTTIDSNLGAPSRKERTDARDKAAKWWKEHETEVRTKWNQPKKVPVVPGAPPAAPTPPSDTPK